jgi:hypothetical protein
LWSRQRRGESCFWRDVMACPVSVQERLRGWWCRGRPFGGRPHADSRVPLTGGRTRHSSERGGVLSPHAPTTSVMAMQCPGWSRRADGDDGDAPDVTAWPCASAEQASVPLRGFRHPLSRVRRACRTRVGGTVSRSSHWPYRTVPYNGRDGLTGRVGGTAPRRDSQAYQGRGMDSSLTVAPASVRALSAPIGGAGMGAGSP